MLIPNILGCIVISVEAVPTFRIPAKEEALRPTIRAMLKPTLGTPLRGVTWINPFNGNAAFLCFVDGEVIQLRKGPGVQSSLVVDVLVLLAAFHLGGLTDVREVLKDDGTARGGVLYDTLRQNVVTVSVEMSLPLAQLF